MRTGAVVTAIAVMLSGALSAARAADYSASGNVKLEANHDSNLLMTEDEQSAAGYTASTRLGFGAATETTSADADLSLIARRFNISGFDSDDQQANVTFEHRAERTTFGLGLRGIRDSTLTSELLDSGRVGSAGRHEQFYVSPYLDYQLSERDQLTLSATYTESSYDDSGFIGYDYWSSALQWSHLLGERSKGFAQLTYSDYSSDDIASAFGMSYSTQSTQWGLQLGGEYFIAESLSLSLLAGRAQNQTEPSLSDPNGFCLFAASLGFISGVPICTLQESDSDVTTFEGSVNWTSLRNSLSAKALRQTQPSSAGYLQTSEQLDLSWEYRFSEFGSVTAKATVGNNEVSEKYPTSRINPSREYQYATLTYAHRVAEAWSLQCSYQYRAQKYDERDRIDSQVVALALVWQPRQRHWSR